MKNTCKHINKKNLNSYNIKNDQNYILVKCIDCGMERHETRYNNGRIEASKWFTPKNDTK